jgi:hypothetical protein
MQLVKWCLLKRLCCCIFLLVTAMANWEKIVKLKMKFCNQAILKIVQIIFAEIVPQSNLLSGVYLSDYVVTYFCWHLQWQFEKRL